MTAAAGEARAALRGDCIHCGLPLLRPREASRAYCCLGCEVAHSVAGASGGGGGEATLILARVGVGVFLAMNVMMLALVMYSWEHHRVAVEGWHSIVRWLSFLLATPAVVLLGQPLARLGWARMRRGTVRVELLVVAAAGASYLLSAVNTVREAGPVYFESATMVLLLVTLGSFLTARARSSARDQLLSLFSEADSATFERRRGGETLAVTASQLLPGDEVVLRKGSRAPVDGHADNDGALLDGSLLSGEPLPRRASVGMSVAAGEVVREGYLLLRATSTAANGALGRMRDAMLRALAHPPQHLSTVDRGALLLILVTTALAVALPIILGLQGRLDEGLLRSLSLLVVACPCALGLAGPLAWTRSLRAAAHRGVIVQSLEALERLGTVRHGCIDKTGTLTALGSEPEVHVALAPGAESRRAEIEAVLDRFARASSHPIAQALATRASGRTDAGPGPLAPHAVDLHEEPGRGIRMRTRGREFCLGSRRWLQTDRSPPLPDGWDATLESTSALSALLFEEGEWLALVSVTEKVRPGVARMLAELAHRGLSMMMLSGDHPARVQALAKTLGIPAEGGLRPDEKAARVRERRARHGPVVVVGDGANDGVALATADVSVVVDHHLDWLSRGADLIITGDRLDALPELVDLSRQVRRRIVGNLAWTGLYNSVALTAGCVGLLSPSLAAAAMVAASLAVVHRSMREYPSEANPRGRRVLPSPQAQVQGAGT